MRFKLNSTNKLLVLVALNLIVLLVEQICSVQTRRIIDRRQQFVPTTNEFHSVINPLQVVHRQSQKLPSLFSGPLVLAAFLFALPLIPSLMMAPLAVAGLPSAFHSITSLMSGMTQGKPIQSFIGPVFNSADNQSLAFINQPIRKQLNMLRTVAKTFRVVINKRYSSPTKNDNAVPETPSSLTNEIIESNKYGPEIVDLIETAASSTVDPSNTNGSLSVVTSSTLTEPTNLQQDTNSSTPMNSLVELINSANQMEKSIRGMDALYRSLRDIYSVIRNGLRRYEITDSECQSRIVCEIHQKIISRNKLLKTFSMSALDILNLERHIDSWSSLNQKSKEVIKFYINAAKIGFADKDCNKAFRNCPTLPGRSLRKMLLKRFV
ncbi:hypothetical protein NH340_JMT06184 [Sarcoptes scabiei]|nr:hypothetical protein NH340_JMT06184 [Sarcoptes scabiei]